MMDASYPKSARTQLPQFLGVAARLTAEFRAARHVARFPQIEATSAPRQSDLRSGGQDSAYRKAFVGWPRMLRRVSQPPAQPGANERAEASLAQRPRLARRVRARLWRGRGVLADAATRRDLAVRERSEPFIYQRGVNYP